MKRRLAAILAADVVGYSAMVQRDELGALQVVKGHFTAFEPHVALHQGRIVKKMGDGFLAEFGSVVEAVACAVELQKTAIARNQSLEPSRNVVLRMGVHSGDIVEEDGDIFGDGVNIASRLEGVASPGAIAISAKVQEEVEARLDLELEDRGLLTLKNIERPLRVFEVTVGAASVPRRSQPELPDKPSIAVLPLQTFSGNPDDDFLADGLTEDLTTALASVPWLFVIARNSAFTYKGLATDIRRIGRELGVRYVVEGSVRRAGDRARITAQLVDCIDGKNIWADKFDGTVEDVFELQDRIVEEVVRAVAPQVQFAEIQKSARKRPDDRTSYDLYLGALSHLNAGRITDAEAQLRSAITSNPDYASAKAILGWCTTLRVAWRSEDDEEALRDRGENLCREALESAQRDIETEAYAGYTLGFHLRDIPLGMALVAGAVEQCPSFAWAWTSRSFLESFFGDPHRGLEYAEQALRLNPRDPLIFRTYHAITTACIGTGDYQRALDMAREGLKYNGSILALHLQKISALTRMQRMEEAHVEATSVLKRHPDFRIARFLEYRGRFQSSAGMADDLRASGLPE